MSKCVHLRVVIRRGMQVKECCQLLCGFLYVSVVQRNCLVATAQQWRRSHYHWQCKEETLTEEWRGSTGEDVAHRPHKQRHHGRWWNARSIQLSSVICCELFRSLIELFRSLIELFRSLVELFRSLIELFRSLIELFRSLIELF